MKPHAPDVIVLPERIDALDVHFAAPKHGWCRITIPALLGDEVIHASEADDPFPDFIAWLDMIVDRKPAPAWQVKEEGATSHLMFLGSTGSLGDEASQFIYTLTARKLLRIGACVIGRRAFVSAFYHGFRHMVEREDYDPFHWEGPGENIDRDDLSDEEYEASWRTNPFDGTALRSLRSEKIEQFLASPPDEWEDEDIVPGVEIIRSAAPVIEADKTG